VDKGSDDLQRNFQNQIAMMESEHRDLDSMIEQLDEVLPFNQLKLKRLKKPQTFPKGRNGQITKSNFARYYCLKVTNQADWRSWSGASPQSCDLFLQFHDVN